jgi:hypothetical protein
MSKSQVKSALSFFYRCCTSSTCTGDVCTAPFYAAQGWTANVCTVHPCLHCPCLPCPCLLCTCLDHRCLDCLRFVAAPLAQLPMLGAPGSCLYLECSCLLCCVLLLPHCHDPKHDRGFFRPWPTTLSFVQI